MALTRRDLESMNERLKATLRALSAENDYLMSENTRLSRSLQAATKQNERLLVRSEKLIAYAKQLQEWLTRNASATPIPKRGNGR